MRACFFPGSELRGGKYRILRETKNHSSCRTTNPMPRPLSENGSSATSPTPAMSLGDLDLPVIAPGEEPLPSPAPSYEAQRAHSLFLLSSYPPSYFADRLARMNPEPFHLG